MEIMHFLIIFLISLSFFFFFEFTFAFDTITSIQSIRNGTTIVSSGQTFELGFFSPGKSGKSYIGIWYKATPDVVVWVANRNNPLNDSFGEFTIGDEGNLVLFDRAKSVVWSSNSSSSVAKNPVAQLLDNGNLVLKESGTESYLWQSFDFPSDTLLQFMKLGWDLRSGFERYLTSWKGVEDPSVGNYTFRLDINGLPQLVMAVGSTRKLRIGPWNGVEFGGFTLGTNNIYKREFVYNENEVSYYFVPINNSVTTRVKINSAEETERLMLESGSNEWAQMYSLPYDLCDNYGYCGANSICRVSADPICQCLDGFVPSSQQDWEFLKWSEGCVRKTALNCHGGDGFVDLGAAKLPDLLDFGLNKSMSLEECKAECLKTCSCVAYANSDVRDGGSGCLMWFGKLIDIRELRVKGTEQRVHVKLSALDMSK